MRRTLFTVGLAAMLLGVVPMATRAEEAQGADYDRARIQLFERIQRAVIDYPHYTVFDSVSVQLDEGAVRLVGRVTRPEKKDELEIRVKGVPGVTSVDNQIAVLPASRSDDELRARIADAIYSHPTFLPYASRSDPAIHIIVERGRVTLEGVVQDESERLLAASLAGSRGALSIANELRTTREAQQEFSERAGTN